MLGDWLLFVLWCASVAANSAMTVFRLPADTRPISYGLKIVPDYGGRPADPVAFDGEVEIAFVPSAGTSNVTLNCKGLNVYAAYVREKDTQRAVDVSDVVVDDANEQLVVGLASPLRANVEYVLDVEYDGRVPDAMDGLYRSAYDDYTEWLLVTFVEPTGARRIFPCYDEPAYKTPFNISVTRPQDKSVRSNTPNSTTEYDASARQVRETFAQTPPMSTHMVAFVVSGFDGTASDGGAVHAYARDPDRVSYVSGEAPRLLKAMEDFTELRYQLPKLDLFAVPDLESDATGGWGLTAYREKYLLLDDASSAKANESALSTVQRAIAGQWFGNLVTCSWWDYLWLHTAFATYFRYFAVHSVHPDWRMDEMFVVEQHQPALAYDQTRRRPITASVRTPAQINDAFRDRTHEKAAAFLRMLKHATNETVFRRSSARYLERNKYGAAEPEELFAAFQSTVAECRFDFGDGVTVTEFMEQWTTKAGYPVIDVAVVGDSFVVTQERFLIDTPDNKAADPTRWPVAVTYATRSDGDFGNFTVAKWCKPSDDRCTVPGPRDPGGWHVFNLQSAGVYRVNYGADNWRTLIGQLNEAPAEIHVLNRAQLIDDSFNLARADRLHYSVPLELSSYLKVEDDVLPWYSAINGYSYLLERMRRDAAEYSEIRECVSDLAGIIYKKVENLVVAQNSTEHTILTSWNAFSVWTCGLNNNVCTEPAYEYYKKWRNGEKIPADITDAAFCVGIRITNDTSTWDEMFEYYQNTKSPSQKQSAQTALACTEDEQLLSRYLNYMFERENSTIRPQDYRDVVNAVSSTPKGLDVLIDFLAQNLNNIVKSIIDGNDFAIFIYSTCASKAALDDEIIRIKKLKDDPNTPENLRQAFTESYSQVENNLYWYNKYHRIVAQNSGCSPKNTTIEEYESTTQIILTETSREPEIKTTSYSQSTTNSEEPDTRSSIEIETTPIYSTITHKQETTASIFIESTTTYMTSSQQPELTSKQTSDITSIHTTKSEGPETTASSFIESTTTYMTTSQQPESTSQQTSEITSIYTTTSKKLETTTSSFIESTTTHMTTSQQPELTSQQTSEITSIYTTVSAEPKTTVSSFIDSTTTHMTTSQQPELTSQQTSEITSIYTTASEEPKTTVSSFIDSTTTHMTTSQQPELTSQQTSEITSIYTTASEEPKTTVSSFIDSTTTHMTTSQQPELTSQQTSEITSIYTIVSEEPKTTVSSFIDSTTTHMTTSQQPELTSQQTSEITSIYTTVSEEPKTTVSSFIDSTTTHMTTSQQPESTSQQTSEITSIYTTVSEEPKTTVSSFIDSTTTHMTTSQQPESTFQQTTEITSIYTTVSEEPKTTLSSFIDSTTTHMTTSQQPELTSQQTSEITSIYTTVSEEPKTTVSSFIDFTTTHMTTSQQPELTSQQISEITSIYTTVSEEPKTTVSSFIDSTTTYMTTSQQPESTSQQTSEITSIYTTVSEEPKTTTSSFIDSTTTHMTTSQQQELTSQQTSEITSIYTTVSEEPKTTVSSFIDSTTTHMTTTQQPKSTSQIKTETTTILTTQTHEPGTTKPIYTQSTISSEKTHPTSPMKTQTTTVYSTIITEQETTTSTFIESTTTYLSSKSTSPFSTDTTLLYTTHSPSVVSSTPKPFYDDSAFLYTCIVFLLIIIFIILICCTMLLMCSRRRPIMNEIYYNSANIAAP